MAVFVSGPFIFMLLSTLSFFRSFTSLPSFLPFPSIHPSLVLYIPAGVFGEALAARFSFISLGDGGGGQGGTCPPEKKLLLVHNIHLYVDATANL